MTPPYLTAERWRTLTAVCRQMDDRYNRAETTAPARTAEKPSLTSRNGSEQGFDRATLATENPVLPALVEQPGSVADTYKEGST